MKKILLSLSLVCGLESLVSAGPVFSKVVEHQDDVKECVVGSVVLLGAVTTLALLHRYSLEVRREKYYDAVRKQDFDNYTKSSYPMDIATQIPFLKTKLVKPVKER